MQKAALLDNIVSAFRQAGIQPTYNKKRGFITAVDIQIARAVRGIEHRTAEQPGRMKQTNPLT